MKSKRNTKRRQNGKPGAATGPGRLRIVAGMWRSRLLDVADVPGLRPTAARIRETLFNWLGPRITGARCLDLFAGTGALGLEALSRGAAQAVFVENSREAADMLRKSIGALGAGGAILREADAMTFLETSNHGPFDIVFLDPPYADARLEAVCRSLATSGLLAPGALVYLEDDRARGEPALPEGWSLVRSKTAGNVRYSLAEAA